MNAAVGTHDAPGRVRRHSVSRIRMGGTNKALTQQVVQQRIATGRKTVVCHSRPDQCVERHGRTGGILHGRQDDHDTGLDQRQEVFVTLFLRTADQSIRQPGPLAIKRQCRCVAQAAAIRHTPQQVAIITPHLQRLTNRAARGAQATQRQLTRDPAFEPLRIRFFIAAPALGDQPLFGLELAPLLGQRLEQPVA